MYVLEVLWYVTNEMENREHVENEAKRGKHSNILLGAFKCPPK